MIKQQSTTVSESEKTIEGFHSASLDNKNRFAVGAKWKENFPAGSKIKMIYAGNYALIVPQDTFEDFDISPELIVHTTQIDKGGRILLDEDFINAYGIKLEGLVFMIGKTNHLELYFQKEKFDESKNRALQATIQFQVNLLLNKKKP